MAAARSRAFSTSSWDDDSGPQPPFAAKKRQPSWTPRVDDPVEVLWDDHWHGATVLRKQSGGVDVMWDGGLEKSVGVPRSMVRSKPGAQQPTAPDPAENPTSASEPAPAEPAPAEPAPAEPAPAEPASAEPAPAERAPDLQGGELLYVDAQLLQPGPVPDPQPEPEPWLRPPVTIESGLTDLSETVQVSEAMRKESVTRSMLAPSQSRRRAESAPPHMLQPRLPQAANVATPTSPAAVPTSATADAATGTTPPATFVEPPRSSGLQPLRQPSSRVSAADSSVVGESAIAVAAERWWYQRAEGFYRRYNPRKAHLAAELMQKYKGAERRALSELCILYGVDQQKELPQADPVVSGMCASAGSRADWRKCCAAFWRSHDPLQLPFAASHLADWSGAEHALFRELERLYQVPYFSACGSDPPEPEPEESPDEVTARDLWRVRLRTLFAVHAVGRLQNVDRMLQEAAGDEAGLWRRCVAELGGVPPDPASSVRDYVAAVYAWRAPQKLTHLPAVLHHYRGREEDLRGSMQLKYGPLPQVSFAVDAGDLPDTGSAGSDAADPAAADEAESGAKGESEAEPVEAAAATASSADAAEHAAAGDAAAEGGSDQAAVEAEGPARSVTGGEPWEDATWDEAAELQPPPEPPPSSPPASATTASVSPEPPQLPPCALPLSAEELADAVAAALSDPSPASSIVQCFGAAPLAGQADWDDLLGAFAARHCDAFGCDLRAAVDSECDPSQRAELRRIVSAAGADWDCAEPPPALPPVPRPRRAEVEAPVQPPSPAAEAPLSRAEVVGAALADALGRREAAARQRIADSESAELLPKATRHSALLKVVTAWDSIVTAIGAAEREHRQSIATAEQLAWDGRLLWLTRSLSVAKAAAAPSPSAAFEAVARRRRREAAQRSLTEQARLAALAESVPPPPLAVARRREPTRRAPQVQRASPSLGRSHTPPAKRGLKPARTANPPSAGHGRFQVRLPPELADLPAERFVELVGAAAKEEAVRRARGGSSGQRRQQRTSPARNDPLVPRLHGTPVRQGGFSSPSVGRRV
eukprot:TRINITY_DN6013_c0_g1_i4.p1 TRINITY_DN6013_c0_g1~~TRINITY_DN6013_c0_g1_i4.p1  ORF type:complete len:1048 (+),score=279.91 TRINITY_DN6013_c0_g1_i4:69-3212(+)